MELMHFQTTVLEKKTVTEPRFFSSIECMPTSLSYTKALQNKQDGSHWERLQKRSYIQLQQIKI